MTNQIIFKKDDIIFSKKDKNIYEIDCNIENKNISILPFVSFEIITLIYELNKDICENIEIIQINETNINVIIIFKNFLEDLGFLQKYCYLNIQKICNSENVLFNCSTVYNPTLKIISDDLELIEIENMVIKINIINPHKIKLNNTIILDTNENIEPFMEKIAGNIISKIFIRIKQFIEKAHVK
jgi:hypothetical protein